MVHSHADTVKFVSEGAGIVEKTIESTPQARLVEVFKVCMGELGA